MRAAVRSRPLPDCRLGPSAAHKSRQSTSIGGSLWVTAATKSAMLPSTAAVWHSPNVRGLPLLLSTLANGRSARDDARADLERPVECQKFAAAEIRRYATGRNSPRSIETIRRSRTAFRRQEPRSHASEEMLMMPPCVSGWNQFPSRLATH